MSVPESAAEFGPREFGRTVASLVRDPAFIAPVALLATIGFGYWTFQDTLSIDDLARDTYVGTGRGMLRGGRLGFYLWAALTTGRNFFPYGEALIALLLLVAAVIAFSALWIRSSGGAMRGLPVIAFACLFMSYPLINEIWVFSLANVSVAGGSLLAALSLATAGAWLDDRRRFGALALTVAMLTWVVSGYEAVIPVYVFGVCAVLLLEITRGRWATLRQVLDRAVGYAVLLLACLLVRFAVTLVLLAITGEKFVPNGDTGVYWDAGPVSEILGRLGPRLAFDYVLAGLWYLPIASLVVSVVVSLVMMAVLARRFRTWGVVLVFAGMGISLVLLSLVKGIILPYRGSLVFGVQVGFAAMLLMAELRNVKPRHLTKIVAVGLAFLSLQQALNLNMWLSLNHQRWEGERYVVRRLGDDLTISGLAEKPVIFVGRHTLPSSITRYGTIAPNDWRYRCVTRLGIDPPDSFIQTNGHSLINWSLGAFETQDQMRLLMAYEGYTIYTGDSRYLDEAKAAATSMPGYPLPGYIKDMGSYVVVKLR